MPTQGYNPLHAVLSGVVQPGAQREERALGAVAVDAAATPTSSGPSNPNLFLHLPILSIRQPWAWLILNAGKDIENRTWRTHFRGQFLIHASKGMTNREYVEGCCFADECGFSILRIPPFGSLERGGIVGMARLTDCVQSHSSPWFVGKWGFVIEDAQPVEFIPCKGALGFFRLSK